MTIKHLARHASVATCALSLAACGAENGTAPAPASIAQPSSIGRISIEFATATTPSASARKRHFLGFDAQSVSIAIDGGAPQIINLETCSPNATNTANVCAAVGVTAPVGHDTIAISDYDGTNAMGNLIGSGVAAVTVTAGQTTPVKISLNGVPYQIIMQLADNVPTTGAPSTVKLIPLANDQNGYYIVGAYADPITLTDDDTHNEITLSKKTLTSSADSVTVSYSGTGTTPVAITGSVAANSQSGSVTLSPGGKYPELAVGNFSNGTPYCGADIYDATGNGSVVPKAQLRGGGDNDGCGRVAIAPNGDVFGLGPVGIFAWHGYLSGNPYGLSSSANSSGGIHFDSAGNMYTDNDATYGDEGIPQEISVEIFAPPFSSNGYPKTTVEIPPQYENFPLTLSAVSVNFYSQTDKNGGLWMPGSDGINEFAVLNGPTYRKASVAYGSTIASVYAFAFGPSNEMWVCDEQNQQVVRVNAGATTFDDHAAIITGQYVKDCSSVQVDSLGDVYVQTDNNVINVFAKTANGAAVPTRSLQLNSGPDLGSFALLD